MSYKKSIIKYSIMVISLIIFLNFSSNITDKGIFYEDKEKFFAGIEKEILRVMGYYSIPGVSIAIIDSGEKIWSKSYGYSNVEKKAKMTLDSKFKVESISKSVTAWGIMKLVEDKTIELDKPVFEYIRDKEFTGVKEITVRQLLNHTSGLSLGPIGETYELTEEVPSLESTISKNFKIINRPGKKYNYSNVGFSLLELLIEEVTGMSFSKYMQNEILEPLRMNHSTFEYNGKLPMGYDLNGEKKPPYKYATNASGGLVSTIDDISKFVIAGMPNYNKSNRVLSNKSIKEMYKISIKEPGVYGLAFDGYGLGHFVEKVSEKSYAVSHGGQGSGIMSHYHSVYENGDGVIIFVNSQRGWYLFGKILKAWGKWKGYNIGMTKIVEAQLIIWILIKISVFLSIFKICTNLISIIKKERIIKIDLKSRNDIFNILISLTMLYLAIWSLNQKYLFFEAVFPIAYKWFEILLIMTSIVFFIKSISKKME